MLGLRTAVTVVLVLGLLGAFLYATKLSYYGSIDIENAFGYQSDVVAAQRDSELLQGRQFDLGVPPAGLRVYEKLLASDLAKIDSNADTPGERAPSFRFPATRNDFDQLTAELSARESLGKQRFEGDGRAKPPHS